MIPAAEEDSSPLTHRVATGAYVFYEGRLLLLKRSKAPFTYAPPGGRLEIGEDPRSGVMREVREETGLEIQVLAVADTWFGSVDGVNPELLCIDYLAEAVSGSVVLNDEHTDFIWVTREQIAGSNVRTTDESDHGYQARDLLFAFDLYRKLRS